MLHQRRIRKQVQPYAFSHLDANKKKQLIQKKANYTKSSYQIIPAPSKSSYSDNTYALYGNVILMEKNGLISMDPSLINNYINYRDVQVTKLSNQKLITIFTENKKNVQGSDWQFLVNKLKCHKDMDSLDWAKTIQSFCESYEQVMNQISSETDQTEACDSAAQKAEQKKVKLMESYPSICFTSELKGQTDDLTEISVNQKFLSEIGYSTDAFASTVLQEGIPQLVSWQKDHTSSMAKAILENYFTACQEEFQSSEFEVPLLLKSGYVKNVKIQVSLLVRKKSSGFIMDIILSIVSKDIPFFQEKGSEAFYNVDFLNIMNFREKEMAVFLSRYYKDSPPLKYTNMHKVCRIQEISGDDDEDDDEENQTN